MSMLYEIDKEVKRQFPDTKETIDSTRVQEIVESIIGEKTDKNFIIGYLSDKGYLFIDEMKTISGSGDEIETKDNEVRNESAASIQAKAKKADDDEFDLDLFLTSDRFNEEMKKAERAADFSDNKDLFRKSSGNMDTATKDTLIEANLPLVQKVASRYNTAFRGSMEYDDLVSEGVIGLMKAIDRYDVNLGYEFSTYAYHWIRQSITRAIADKALMVRLPVHILEKLNKINKIERKLWEEHENFDIEEIARRSEITEEQYLKLKTIESNFRHATSLNTPLKEESDEDILMMIHRESTIWISDEKDLTSPTDFIDDLALKEEMGRLLDNLSEKESLVLKRRYGFDDDREMTLEEIGSIIGVTRERIRQIQGKALRKLTIPSHRRELKEFIYS